ncbi:MAG: hypothetical protein HKN29_15070 [Rhodothermales bacterium]|nr:hypothetical protein [Rhodothermales bacterium]
MRALILLLAFVACTGTTAAQPVPEDWPVAAEADVASVDAILAAVYDVISGPAGPRDWDRFKSLFRPEARLIPIASTPDGSFPMYWSPGEYAERASGWFAQQGFFEVEIARTMEQYGPMTHLFSTYESYDAADAPEPFARGINSFQLFNDGDRWWVVNIYWQAETGALPIPDQYLPGG